MNDIITEEAIYEPRCIYNPKKYCNQCQQCERNALQFKQDIAAGEYDDQL